LGGNKLEIVQRIIKDLIPAEYNPRQINKDAFEQLKRSLDSFECVEPAVINVNPDRFNVIVGGHQRIKAASALKWKEFPCIEVNLPIEKEKELNVRLNKNTGEFDFDMLANNFDVSDLLDWGFDEKELDWAPEMEGLCDENEIPEVPERPINMLGDMWILGDHRLRCGDSTVSSDVDELLNGQKIDMLWTDPPYGMSYGGGRARGNHSLDKKTGGVKVKAHGEIIGDDLRGNDLIDMIADSLLAAKINAKEGAAYYVCFPWRTYAEFEAGLINVDLHPTACIVWDKKSIGLGNANYRPQHEFIFYIKGGAWYGDKSQSDIWSMSRGATGDYVHPTQKPVELIEIALKNSSKAGDLVHDCFGGSGSTMIACEKLSRANTSMELDPKYCDVIIKRWEKFTGKEAFHVNGQSFNAISQMRTPSVPDSN
jgi:DNA modification methylase